jgi:hypothetical protein
MAPTSANPNHTGRSTRATQAPSASSGANTNDTPAHRSPAYGPSMGANTVGRTHTRSPISPASGNSSARCTASATAAPSIHGAPTCAKGASVPRPTLTDVPSSRHVPGYHRALAHDGIAGDVGTHGTPVAGHARVGSHPAHGTTVSDTAGTASRCHSRASSPSVRLWRTGMDDSPTNDRQSSSSSGPSAAASTPPSGLGRSSTTTGTPDSAQACSRCHSVHA